MAGDLGGWGGGALPGPWGMGKGARTLEKEFLLENKRKSCVKINLEKLRQGLLFWPQNSQENQIQVSVLTKQLCGAAASGQQGGPDWWSELCLLIAPNLGNDSISETSFCRRGMVTMIVIASQDCCGIM